MLDSSLTEQLRDIFSQLSNKYTLLIERHPNNPKSSEMVELIEGIAECSKQIEVEIVDGEDIKLSIVSRGEVSGIEFRAVPTGHEFSSLILAILNLDGKGTNFPDEITCKRVGRIKGELLIKSYISLSCTNCPDVVQAINLLTICNHRIKHQIIDGALYQDEVETLAIQSVPTLYCNNQLLHVGRGSLAQLLEKLEQKYGTDEGSDQILHHFDVTIAGGGPAGVTSALYLARKGLNVAVVTERVGGQVNETNNIENIPSIITILGIDLASNMKLQMERLPNLTLLDNRTIVKAEIAEELKMLTLGGGEVIESPQLIIATGAQWKKLGIEGEADYIGHGVAFCPHCDGPLFKGKSVAVIGGGNSGVEAAIDLAMICEKVYLYEFTEMLKADDFLQRKLSSLPNVEVFLSHQVVKIIGSQGKVSAVETKNRTTDVVTLVELSGVFVQIGLSANSILFKDMVSINKLGEIEVDKNGRTSTKGVYAAGDVTNGSYKQIIISMGEGAKAALATFDDKIRNI